MNTWHNTQSKPLSSLNFNDLYESLKPLGLAGVMIEPFPYLSVRYVWDKLCRKCAGKNTRRHHRKCSKRGIGHKNRERDAHELETRAIELCGIVVRIRRGRCGKGLSLRAAEKKVLRAHVLRVKPLSFADLIRMTYGPDVKIETTEPGTVSITTDVDADPKHVIEDTPFGVRVIVNGVAL